LPAGARLDPTSLPVPGRVSGWLELRTQDADCDGEPRCTLRLAYQVFAVPTVPSVFTLPPLTLRVLEHDGAASVAVPAAPFVLAPTLVEPATAQWLEPIAAPAPGSVARSRPLLFAILSTAGALCAGLWALWVDDRLPWLPRRPGPFTRLARAWRGRQQPGLHDMLRACLRAMNESAGETLYASSLDRLFERTPALAPLRSEFVQFAQRAWAALHGSGEPPSAAAVTTLVRLAAERERRGRR